MPKTEMINARVDAKLKAEAEGILEKLGLDASAAIRLFYQEVAAKKGLPFARVPNATTRRVLKEADEGKNLTHYESTEAMFDDILGEGWRTKDPR